MREYAVNNREALMAKQLIYEKKRRRTDETFRLKHRMRARLGAFLRDRNFPKTGKTFDLIGCTPGQLKRHLSNQMKKQETLEKAEADHIFPLSRYRIQEKEQQAKAMHYTNMQPLTKLENELKQDKLPTKAMAAKVHPDCWPDGITMDMLPDIYPGWATPLRMHADGEEEGQAASSSSGAGSSADHARM